MNKRSVVVVGASMGGVEALTQLLGDLPANFPGSIFIVQHTAASASSGISSAVARYCALPVKTAKDGEPIAWGRVYTAAPDYHLLIKPGHLRVVRGPRENRVRPAVDPLFRSAAVAYGSRATGVVLTGYQNDGSAGLAAIKRCGGTTIVQDPDDAAFPEMPLNALQATVVDHCVPLSKLASLLDKLVREEVSAGPTPPSDIALEVDIAERVMSDVPKENLLGHPAPFGCPECGGPLWEIEDPSVKRFRCHVGHAYTSDTLLADQSEAVEKALWVAMRTLEERATMLRKLAEEQNNRGRTLTYTRYEERAREAEQHAASVRGLLLGGQKAV